MPPRSDIRRGYRPTYHVLYTIYYSTVSAQQTNILPENTSQNDCIFPIIGQKAIWHISDPSHAKFLWLCNHRTICNSYNMDTRALAHLLHEGAKRPRVINELSA